MKASTSKKTLTGVAGAAAVLAAAVAVTAAHGGGHAPTPIQAPAPSTASGLLAAKDPVTGELRAPTAEEISQLQAQKSLTPRRRAEPVEQRLANGAYIATLDPSYDLTSIAVRGANGKILTACVPAERVPATLEAAQQRLQTPTTKEVLDEK